MEDRAVRGIQTVIRYIESRLGGRLELETVAEAVHYSKYHLHRMFTETVGMTLHDYVQRRRLTEAAKLLAFSRRAHQPDRSAVRIREPAVLLPGV